MSVYQTPIITQNFGRLVLTFAFMALVQVQLLFEIVKLSRQLKFVTLQKFHPSVFTFVRARNYLRETIYVNVSWGTNPKHHNRYYLHKFRLFYIRSVLYWT